MIYIIQIINYTLSFLMWMILGRMLLVLIIGNRQNILTGLFIKITEPVYRITKKVLPFANERHIPWLSILLIIIIRLAIIIIFRPAAGR
ncbi:MAG: hypothetical protein C4550_06190 [Nitrospiraceae bacterium]|nr:MAG: hypothetical protein C4550_06190 [Nitrospiraceae bacterium]